MDPMTQLRIDIGELPAVLRQALEEGREVLVEDHGAVVARVERCERDARVVRGGDLRAFVEARKKSPRLGEDWERDMAQIAEWINQPAEPPAWE